MSIFTKTQAGLPTGTWREDPVHSNVGFEIGYAGGTFKGTFSPFEAKLSVDGEDASLEGQAQAVLAP